MCKKLLSLVSIKVKTDLCKDVIDQGVIENLAARPASHCNLNKPPEFSTHKGDS